MLTPQQIEICHNTISANAFLWLVMDALERKANLSVVRAADGEKKLLEHCQASASDTWGTLEPFDGFTAKWLKKYGCEGISKVELRDRIECAIRECTYFAPSLSGITIPAYDVYGIAGSSRFSPCLHGPFPGFARYEIVRFVDNFFPNLWNEEQKIALFQAAGHVLFIHGDLRLADAMQNRAKVYYDVKVSYQPLSNWNQAEGVIREANKIKAPLTIFSAGPASKFIGPRIAGVTLDIGAAAYRWSFLAEFERRKALADSAGHLEEFFKKPYENS